MQCWVLFSVDNFEFVEDTETLLSRIVTMMKHGSSSGTLKQNRSPSWFTNSQEVRDTITGCKNNGLGGSGFSGNPANGLHVT
jgi:hypothetical protein